MRAERCFQFRVTRSSDLFVDEEAIDDLRSALEVELSNRHLGTAVRLEVAKTVPRSSLIFWQHNSDWIGLISLAAMDR